MQIFGHMLPHRLLSIFLHTGVERSVYLQTIRIDVIVLTVLLLVLVTPSEQRISLPSQRVVVVLLILPRSVVASVRLLSHHHLAQTLTQIRSNTLIMRSNFEQRHIDRHLTRIVKLCPRDIPLFQHLLQHHIPTLLAHLIVTNRIVERRILTHTHQHRTLVQVQVIRSLTEVSLRSTLDAHSIVEEVKLVQVHRDDFLLRVELLQLNGYVPLYRLL